MSHDSNKAINTISYVLNVLLVIALIFALKGGFQGIGSNDADIFKEIKLSIVERENAELPVTIQKLSDVRDIKIDSLVITSDIKPYSGYLVTQWKYDTWNKKGLKKQVYVEVNNIRVHNKSITWYSNWIGAKLSLD